MKKLLAYWALSAPELLEKAGATLLQDVGLSLVLFVFAVCALFSATAVVPLFRSQFKSHYKK